jgi:two-component system, chemotaxis family, protein-glutamate methylesterase/glutaminase
MAVVKQRLLKPGERIRVMVVDDSVVIRRLVTKALASDPLLEVVGTASSGAIGLQRISELKPDLITLDIEMPDMNGLEMLKCVRRDYPSVRVIMFSTLTERGAGITLQALSLGADEYIAKVSNEASLDESMVRLRDDMIPKIKQFFRPIAQSPAPTESQPNHVPAAVPALPPKPVARGLKVRPKAVVVGISTGGPAALAAILPSFPASFPLPILVVQHMPPLFTRLLAARLNQSCELTVKEASQDDPVEPGTVLLAPGDFHMKVVSKGGGVRVSLDQTAQQNSCRPAVDPLFASAAQVFGGAVIAVVLTGMGYDGLRGTEALKARGASVIAQDEATSVVWGMPGAVANAGLADRVLPLDQVVPEILILAGRN